ncbi:hypothetical protein [Pseudoalteromonas piscicida]|uniref:hypothetical protein n=1 Tax=Pseudoalteromonas piscicida TaxID=43662 RepID=UPI001C963543|nr:hypothetical protein [Pseudoalteromonas piscicida]QZO13478.1 hypothetical protein K5642_02820 [Pseudoalteromonas piscicida]
MKFIIILNLIVSSVIGVFHLLLIDISFSLKALAVFNLLYATYLFFKTSRSFKLNYLIVFFIVSTLLCIQFFFSLDNKINRVVVDFLAILVPMFYFMFISSCNFKSESRENLALLLDSLMKFIVYWSIFIMFVMYAMKYGLGLHFNLTFGSPLIALAAAVAMYHKRYAFLIACFVIVILSGKRSIMIFTFLCVLGVHTLILFANFSLHRAIKSLSKLLISIAVIITALLSSWDSLVELNPKLKKVEYLLSQDADVYQKSTGRTDEITQAYEMADFSHLDSLLVGLGMGTEFEISFDKYDTTKEKNNIHFTPLNIYLKYGLFFLCAFYLILLALSIRVRRKAALPVNIYCFFYVSFYTMTNFGVVVDYSFWALLSFLTSVNSGDRV